MKDPLEQGAVQEINTFQQITHLLSFLSVKIERGLHKDDNLFVEVLFYSSDVRVTLALIMRPQQKNHVIK